MKILLIDMDGVLLEPRGYLEALCNTVNIIGQLLGYPRVQLPRRAIAQFESAGFTSEWEMAAICTALLLDKAWTLNPTLALPHDPDHLPNGKLDLDEPDFLSFARALNRSSFRDYSPLERLECLLAHNTQTHTSTQRKILQDLFYHNRKIDCSLSLRIFQELVLGSEVYSQSYGLKSFFNTKSYLQEYDRPAINQATVLNLLQWLDHPQNKAVIFTNRPTRGFGNAAMVSESEIGAQLVGLADLPIIGYGEIAWLANHCSTPEGLLMKPSPVHALAALRLVIDRSPDKALETASALAFDRVLDHLWYSLVGAEIHVFEDTEPGLESVRASVAILGEYHIPVSVSLHGISSHPAKQRVLKAAGAMIHPNLAIALENVFSLQ